MFPCTAYDASNFKDGNIYRQMVDLSDVLWADQELNEPRVQACLRNKDMNIHRRANALLEDTKGAWVDDGKP